MKALVVVENPSLWPLDVPGIEVVAARNYLTNPLFMDLKRAKVFNLCRTYGFQTVGYYVSLLAAARGHKPLPSVTTLQDLRLSSLVRIVSEDLEDMLQRLLSSIKGDRFDLSIYFGRNLAKRYDRLCGVIFNHFPAPFLRAEFVFADQWRLHRLRTIATSEIPEHHRQFVIEQIRRFFSRPSIAELPQPKYDIAILVNPQESTSPSDDVAINRFVRAARNLGMEATILDRDDIGRIAEFDGLFIRETTAVDHHTYRFSSRAEAEGLVVIDDPESIVRCSNKVYQAELFERYGINTPKTLVVHKDNANDVGKLLGFPCVLKEPDSSFSLGVVKANDQRELQTHIDAFFEKSELLVAQKFMPSEFDWRIGVLDGKPLYACKYYMAKGHWQIAKRNGITRRQYGKVETLKMEDVPDKVTTLALRAANLMGRGLYGVDIKQVNGRFLVVEVNDNPNIDGGYEDSVLKDDLYLTVMRWFYNKIDNRGLKH